MPDPRFLRGARPTPRHKLLAAVPHRITRQSVPMISYVPKQLSMWLNDQYGDCVTAEEAFAKACQNPEIFITDATVKAFASANDLLNGADLPQVMDLMKKGGFKQDGKLYGDGGYKAIDYSSEDILQNALSYGPLKLGMDADALPDGAGNVMGWVALGDGRKHTNEDHCTSLSGFGTPDYLFNSLQLAVPSGTNLKPTGIYYAHYTWKTIGVVDFPWIMGTVGEAWLRDPLTLVDGTALPDPGPGPNQPPIDWY